MERLNVPMPDRIKALPRDARGYPIPVVVLRDSMGVSHFALNDSRVAIKCALENRCSVCGDRLLRGKWFVGGPLSAFDPWGSYYDPPVHIECMEYSCRVCPYLAAPGWNKPTAQSAIKKVRAGGDSFAFVEADTRDLRPHIIVAAMASGFVIKKHEMQVFFTPRRPLMRVRFWLHGQELSRAEATAIDPARA